MKASTLMTTVMLSASCFAAPLRTAPEGLACTPAVGPDAAPVAPPAPGIAAADRAPRHWAHIMLPESQRLDQRFAVQNEHLQT